MNYDHVGYLALDAGATGYSGSHHTLPLPSYVEVTSLETGRTILVRLERRGPMNSNDLLALSPAALTQLGATPDTPVRVRRVNPPEEHRFLLRAGEAAPLRMDTPASLLTVLQRRLPETGTASLNTNRAVSESGNTIQAVDVAASTVEAPPANTVPIQQELPALAQAPAARASASETTEGPPALPPLDGPRPVATSPTPAAGAFAAAFGERSAPADDANATPAPETVPATQPAQGRFVVQAAAFSTEERADRVAGTLDGFVMQAGRYWRVRTGPFATRGEAEASLANVRRAGYSDARILDGG
ncbi:SPOR domain-containing protein [Aurantiacibacter sp. D1-12]|uniref:SPOR domain-containing protein n=1 Tax=Aurantiacibacter sp. D1-12 TaxID=2993658 RepID=UPI00237CE21A|nr:SPOR domain-containing protein [Aurantiacibacter sp. D1-12]MDE1466747.1 SPOR domain-containing protein [Aurantiacibacter sp. D1-12]